MVLNTGLRKDLDKLGPSLRGGGRGETPASGVDPELWADLRHFDDSII